MCFNIIKEWVSAYFILIPISIYIFCHEFLSNELENSKTNNI
jgi:hypothetical protein